MTLRTGEVHFSEQGESFILPEAISLFGFSVSFYGLFLVVAALIGIIVTTNMTRRNRRNTELTLNLLILVILCALFGGRLYYVLFALEAFLENPIELLNFRSGGFSYFGALFGAWFGVKRYCRVNGEDFFQSADMLSLGAAAAAPFIWLGCAFAREPLGTSYDGLFSVRIDRGDFSGAMHPVALYGVVFTLLSCIVLFVYAYKGRQSGSTFTLYLILNSIGCIVLEYFRADSYCIWGTKIPANYIVAGVILLTIVTGRIKRYLAGRRSRKKFFIGVQ